MVSERDTWRILLVALAVGLGAGCDLEETPDGSEGADVDAVDTETSDADGSSDTSPDGTDDTDAGDDFEESDSDIAAVDAEVATPEQIGLTIPIGDDLSAYDAATVRYRRRRASDWREAHPLLRIHPEWSGSGAPEPPKEAFAGTIFDLEPGTTYEVEVTLRDDDGSEGERTYQRVLSTRSLPEETGPATETASPGDDLEATINALEPGDVLELEAGTYQVDGVAIRTAGTAEDPIVVRGTKREDVVIEDGSGRILHLIDTSHLVLEQLTVRGSGKDSGTDADSRGIAIAGGMPTKSLTLRNLDIVGVDMGIVARDPVQSTLVYDNVLEGNNDWDEEALTSNETWNDDGIRLPGAGNCAFDNRLDGFGDSFAVKQQFVSTAVHFYRNRITVSGDDAFEGDYSTRNVSFYDNYITNSATFLSLDPLWGGPLYAHRNIVLNTARGPFKLNSKGSGFLVYNNTIVRTEGLTGWAWVQYAKGPLRNFAYRNNAHVYRGPSDNLFAFEPSGMNPIDFTHNAWYPDGSVWWTNSGGTFGSIGEARKGLPATDPAFGEATKRHADDVIASSSPFTSKVPLGSDYSTEVEYDRPVRAAEDSKLRGGGVSIPGITNGHGGSAPDIGATIEGRPVPSWGPDRGD